jgi:phosphoadenosine phosphosulfate reductase
MSAESILRDALQRFAGRIVLVSSFGAESAVLLHVVAGIDTATPVIFLDTGKLFPETLLYRDRLVARLGLRDLRVARPRPSVPDRLWETEPDLCCWQRKVEPLDAALEGFDAWITGRKRVQSATRASLEPVERGPDGRVKINPLFDWAAEEVKAYFVRNDLPPHPLTLRGYGSIGCAPCTRPMRPGEHARAGRWAGTGKTECGMHSARSARMRESLSL